MASLSKQRTASVIAASQLRAELSSCRVQAKEANANVFSTAMPPGTGSRIATSTSGGTHGVGTTNGELQHGPTSSTPRVLQIEPVESGVASESASSGLGSVPTSTPAQPRSAEVREGGPGRSPIASAGRKSQQNDASPAEPQAIHDPTMKQPGEKWSHYYARRAAGD